MCGRVWNWLAPSDTADVLLQMDSAKVTFFAMQNLINQLLFNPEQFLADMKAVATGHAAPLPDIEQDVAAAINGDAAASAAPAAAYTAAAAGTSAPKSPPHLPTCTGQPCPNLRSALRASSPR